MAAITVRGLTKRFKDTVAVDDLSFEVAAGTVTGFLGPNGSGKTTTLRCLLGLVAPTRGSAAVLGAPYRDLPDPLRRVGAVLEASSFHPGRTARNHLRTVARPAGIPDTRVDELLDLVGLTDVGGRRTNGFSLGMGQRLALAAALLGDPEVLILDEPANGLDPEGIRWLRTFLRGLAAQGRAVLVSSHVLAEVAQTVDRAVIIGGGRLLAEGTLDDLVGGVTTVRVRTPQRATLAARLRGAGLAVTERGTEELTITGATAEQVGALAAVAGAVVYEIAAEPVTLEDVFFRLTSGDAPAGGAPTAEVHP